MDDSTTNRNTRLVAVFCSMACGMTLVSLAETALGVRSDTPVGQLEILTIAALVGSFWGRQGWRCADAMNALKTTSFVAMPFVRGGLTRFPLLLVWGSCLVLPAYFCSEFTWMRSIVTLIWCTSVLSFVAIGSAVLDLHEGREPFMVTAKFAHGLGGVFGTILAHFTFRGHAVLDRVPKSAPTVILAIIFWFSAPVFFALAVRNSVFSQSPASSGEMRPLTEAELLSPLGKFTSKGRPIGEPRGLTVEEYDSMTRSGWGGTLGPRPTVNRAMDRGY